ncbi:MAG: hypothetical protein ABI977_10255 [Acidobacteriota bacterium]
MERPAAAPMIVEFIELTVCVPETMWPAWVAAHGKYFLLARSVSENEANSDTLRPAAFDTAQRIQLRREAEAAKNEITLEPCSRVKDHAVRF